MSFLRSKFNSVYCKTRSLSPQCIEFCEHEIHDPLYDCCFGLELTPKGVQCFDDCHKVKCDGSDKSFLSKKIFPNKKEISGGSFKSCFKHCKPKRRKLRSGKLRTSSLPTPGSISKIEKAESTKISPKITVTVASTPLMSPTVRPLSIKCKSTSNLSHLSLDKPLMHSQFSKSTNRLATVYPSRTYEWNSIFQNLCDQFSSMRCASPQITRNHPQVSQHDKKILKCMAFKRIEQITQLEDAVTARQDWERERMARKYLLAEQNLEFGNIIKEKRKLENLLRDQRTSDLLEQQRSYMEKIRSEIQTKDHRLRHRMRTIKHQQFAMQNQRRQDEQRKTGLAVMAQEENRIDEEIRRRECYQQLEHRITRADLMRNYLIGNYRRRINENNEKHQFVHAINYEEVKKMEKLNLEMLRERLNDRDKKCKQFLSVKQKWVEESRDHARVTSELRDILRRSISPDNYSYRNNLNTHNERHQSPSFSVYESHLKLG